MDTMGFFAAEIAVACSSAVSRVSSSIEQSDLCRDSAAFVDAAAVMEADDGDGVLVEV